MESDGKVMISRSRGTDWRFVESDSKVPPYWRPVWSDFKALAPAGREGEAELKPRVLRPLSSGFVKLKMIV